MNFDSMNEDTQKLMHAAIGAMSGETPGSLAPYLYAQGHNGWFGLTSNDAGGRLYEEIIRQASSKTYYPHTEGVKSVKAVTKTKEGKKYLTKEFNKPLTVMLYGSGSKNAFMQKDIELLKALPRTPEKIIISEQNDRYAEQLQRAIQKIKRFKDIDIVRETADISAEEDFESDNIKEDATDFLFVAFGNTFSNVVTKNGITALQAYKEVLQRVIDRLPEDSTLVMDVDHTQNEQALLQCYSGDPNIAFVMSVLWNISRSAIPTARLNPNNYRFWVDRSLERHNPENENEAPSSIVHSGFQLKSKTPKAIGIGNVEIGQSKDSPTVVVHTVKPREEIYGDIIQSAGADIVKKFPIKGSSNPVYFHRKTKDTGPKLAA